MDLIKQKATKRSSSSQEVEVPYEMSRGKALQYVENRSDGRNCMARPEKDGVNKMYELYLRIGATNELPSEAESTQAYLEDFWRIIYLENNLIPADIPFDVVIDEFTAKLVRGEVDRKGNNQAAICQAFNRWITLADTRNKLYYLRDRKYPSNKPKQLHEGSGFASSQQEADMNRLIKGKKVPEWPDEVVLDQFKKITEEIYPGEGGKKVIENFGGGGYMHATITEAQNRGLV